MPEVIALRHESSEDLGIIAEVLREKHISIRVIHSYANEKIPHHMSGADGLILMGGPMGVYESSKYPFLNDEIVLIKEALKENKPILCVCLGSQLLAVALGAKVEPGKKELGWHEVRLTSEAQLDPLWRGMQTSFTGFHWHGDVFELPQGAIRLASSNLTRYQAFRYGENAYGFLFHLEMTEYLIQEILAVAEEELSLAGINESEITDKINDYLPPLQEIGKKVFSRWANLIKQ